MKRLPAVAIANREKILSLLREGIFVKDIAQSLGVSKQAISESLRKDPEYRNARKCGAQVRLDRAHELLAEVVSNPELADNHSGIDKEGNRTLTLRQSLDLARIREIGLKHEEWRIEREFPEEYASQKNSLTVHTHQHTNTLEILGSDASDLLKEIKSSETEKT